MLNNHTWRVAAAAAIAGLVLLGSQWLLLGQEEHRLVGIERAPEQIIVRAGETVVQRIVLGPGLYNGVVLYSDAERLIGQPLSVTMATPRGTVLARGNYVTSAYDPAHGDVLRLTIATRRWTVIDRQDVLVNIRARSHDLALRVTGESDGDGYRHGELAVAGALTSRDAALSVLAPDGTPFGVRQGVLAGVAVWFGALLLTQLRARRQQWRWAALLTALTVFPVLAGYWYSTGRLGIADWDYYFSLHHAWRQTLLAFGEFPFWNPYTCGGTAGLADPEFSVLTPAFLFELLFDVPAGLRLAIYFSVIVGAWGMLALGRRLGLSPLAALLAALPVAFGTVNLLEVTEGHVNILAAMWLPWIFWSWYGAYAQGKHRTQTGTDSRQSTEHKAQKHKPAFGIWNLCFGSLKRWQARRAMNNHWPLVCGIFLALTFYQGGIYLLMYTGLTFLALLLFVREKRAAARVTVQAALWAMGLSAIKLLPVLLWLRQFPDESYAGSAHTLRWLGEILLGRHVHGTYLIPNQVSGWHEYGAYVGYVVFALALIGAARAVRTRAGLALLAGGLSAALLSAAGPLLAPLFDQLWFFPRSNISRIIVLAVIALALLAGFGLDWLRRRVGRWAAVTVLGLAAVEIMSLSYRVSEQAFVLPEVFPMVEPATEPIAYIMHRYDPAGEGSRTTRAYAAARAGWGTFAYCSVLGPKPAVRTVHDEVDNGVLLVTNRNGSWQLLGWSPNAVRVRVTTPEKSEVILNENYAHGWLVNGLPAREVAGRVGVQVESGERELLFSYRAPGWRTGALVSGATLLGAAGAVRGVVKRARSRHY